MSVACNICNHTQLEALYALQSDSITSMRAKAQQSVSVHFCHHCGHTMTDPLEDIEAFYAENYNINTGAEDEDQLLRVVEGKKLYRSDFQKEVLLKKVPLSSDMAFLDYGSAKANTLKKIIQEVTVTPYVFDVSEAYRHYWNGMVPKENQATYTIPSHWEDSMDVVASFFCLEHVAHPVDILETQFAQLKENGRVFLVVPDFSRNVADFLVADHVNHFSPYSMKFALEKAGFTHVEIDQECYGGWMVATAVKPNPAQPTPAQKEIRLPEKQEVEKAYEISRTIAKNWNKAKQALKDYSTDNQPIAIYGAGFYGTYAIMHLNKHIKMTCFIDQNPFLQGKEHFDYPVYAPDKLPDNIHEILVALNPVHAQKAMESVEAWKERNLKFVYVF